MKILKGISSGVVDENAKILKNGETDLSTDEYFYRLGSASAKKLLDLGLNSVPPLKVINKTYKILKTLYTMELVRVKKLTCVLRRMAMLKLHTAVHMSLIR